MKSRRLIPGSQLQSAERRGHVQCCTWLLTAAVLITVPAAWPGCAVNATGVNFGSYDPFHHQDLVSTGSIEVGCDVATSYSISLSPGQQAYAVRALRNGDRALFYNLYTDLAHTQVWGDGTAGTVTVSTTATSELHTVYGSIPANQNSIPGNFTDTIVVTLSF